MLSDEAKRLLYDKGLLRQSIPQQSQHSSSAAAAFYAAGARIHHPTNLAQTFAQAQTAAAFWATYNGTARSGGGGLAGAAPGGRTTAGAGLAGARPFLFVPGAAAAAPQFNMNINLNGLLNRQFTPRFGFQQHHPFNKF